jgi:hypothetical protein
MRQNTIAIWSRRSCSRSGPTEVVAIEATAGFEAVVAAGLVGAGLPDDLQSEKGYKPFVAYSQSTLANLLYGG